MFNMMDAGRRDCVFGNASAVTVWRFAARIPPKCWLRGMSAAFFPSIHSRIDKSVPKFGARCTINRAVGPFGVGVGVGRAFASTLATEPKNADAMNIASIVNFI